VSGALSGSIAASRTLVASREHLEHPPEVIAAKLDHQVRETEALVLAEEIHDGGPASSRRETP
jgi:hypothetical protein